MELWTLISSIVLSCCVDTQRRVQNRLETNWGWSGSFNMTLQPTWRPIRSGINWSAFSQSNASIYDTSILCKEMLSLNTNHQTLTSIWIWTTPLSRVLTANTNTPSWPLEELMRTRKWPGNCLLRRYAASVLSIRPANQLVTETRRL